MTEKLPDVWTWRDYPTLLSVARRLDAGEGVVASEQITADTGLAETMCARPPQPSRLAGSSIGALSWAPGTSASAE